MSHFTVLVVSEEKPNEEVIANLLAPFQESPEDDDYLEWHDAHEEVLKEWKTRRVDKYMKAGQLKDPWDKEFSKPLDNDESVLTHKTEEEIKKEGWSKVQIPVSKNYASIEHFAAQWMGYHKNGEGRFGYMSNPNAHWDWWEIGGRWNNNIIPGNIIQKKALDLESLKRKHLKEAKKEWLAAEAEYNTHPYKDLNFTEAQAKYVELYKSLTKDHLPNDEFIKKLNDHPEFRPLQKSLTLMFGEVMGSLKEYLSKVTAIQTFAILKDGEWVERGDMGWFAVVSNEKDETDWRKEYEKVLNSIPDDHWLTIVDCHI